ncbi:ectoine hydroxylase-related dioxygenase (phytanoyl-CoA dioxygenase family) [Novosphingobium sp. PhB165]|uniref:phytanoyl-CoA dioxygenase family protein n=1 Tax=Novosphingobium sp. PhB165 TaxID=2485105 RepID=UPI001052270A|nr:phytanoyl-CoA dioxygenase family protein [Novosphingobium sp. PhB165]TCM13007.1 ectoine hydroxylase-related dioxygenase (phytanoyl-CoA dioxygenase family) [Novosphingobium sp. PhB165]
MDLFTQVARHAAQLKEHGYSVIENALAAETISALDADLAPRFHRTPFCQGGFYGETTKRFGRLLAHSPHAEALVRHALIISIAEQILLPWCDCIQLNTTQAIAVHGGAPAQLPHRDQDMWGAPKGSAEYLVNVMWPLTPFTAGNGATLVWPRSHGAAALEPETSGQPVAVEIPPGAALLFLGSTLHGAGSNTTEEVRRGIVVGYSLGWLKPYEAQWLAYPPDIARRFNPELAALVGYRQHRPNLGNYEGQCPSVLLDEDYDPDRPLAATDALRPDQLAMVNNLTAERAGVS